MPRLHGAATARPVLACCEPQSAGKEMHVVAQPLPTKRLVCIPTSSWLSRPVPYAKQVLRPMQLFLTPASPRKAILATGLQGTVVEVVVPVA